MKRPPMLGELEAEVMDIAWEGAQVTVKDVSAKLSRGRAYNTVQTTLDRLFRKSLLRREKQSHAFVYSPTVTRAEYHRMLFTALAGALLPSAGEPVLSAFVELAADADSENLDRLESLIIAKRKAEQESGKR